MRAAAAAIALVLAGCAGAPPVACAPGETSGEVAQLFFGRNIGDEVGVSEADFEAFLDAEVTPRFPEGLTQVPAAGRWRGGDGQVRREPSFLVVLASDGVLDRRALGEVRDAYRRRFSQEAVLQLTTPVCMAF
ncbi:DUF3574 domain-containing protein [Phenylobacterium sp.]|uniref:DUF3574 domain-containing protein n=1 Tax=Phenylobacterium sp. TaxID=1871053 RepID=UPI0035C7FF30